MCLAIPGKIVEIIDAANHLAKIDIGGVRRNVNTAMLDNASIGDYVLVHVGFAMSKINEREAQETWRILAEMGAYQEEVDQFKTALE